MANPPNALGISGAIAAYYGNQKLNAAQKEDIANLLFKKLGSRACEMCSQTAWAIGDNIVGPQALLIDRINKAYSTDWAALYPSIHLVCTNCGNTKLFLLTQLGYDPFGAGQ